MKRSALRSFGIAFILIGVFLTLSKPISPQKLDEELYKERITQLEQQLQEANELITELEQDDEPIASKNESAEEHEPDAKHPGRNPSDSQEENSVTDTLYIYSGLTPAEVAQKLKDMKIIDNSVEMELYLAQPEYATSIQKGQYTLNSDMTIKEIADLITGKSVTE